jgi:hypothetical protein
LVFFGNGVDDANSGNRLPGQPALTVDSGAPVYASNYVNLSVQAGATRWDAIGINVPRDATQLASGFTWCAVVRCANLGGANTFGMVWADTHSGSSGVQTWEANAGGTAPGRLTHVHGGSNRGFISLTNSIIANWHFVALTYSGGGTGTFTLYDFTENSTTGVPLAWATTGVTWTTGNQSMHFGSQQTGETQATGPIEHAFGLAALSVLPAPTIAQVAAWARPQLARRGIVC